MDVIANELGIRFDSGLYKGIAAKGGAARACCSDFHARLAWRRSRSRSELPQDIATGHLAFFIS
jgi:hypothetical protein